MTYRRRVEGALLGLGLLALGAMSISSLARLSPGTARDARARVSGRRLFCHLGYKALPLPVQWPWNGAGFEDVAVGSATDAWAVGWTREGDLHPFVSHLVGNAFRTVATPAGPQGGALEGVTLAGGRPLAVGYWMGPQGGKHPLAELLTTGGWRVLDTSAGDGPRQEILEDVDATSATDAWAVGESADFTTALLLHWNGRAWARARTGLSGQGVLFGVDALPGEVWAVGGQDVLHRVGGTWHRLTVPLPPDASSVSWFDVAARTSTDVWVVGRVEQAKAHTVAAHWNGSTWTTVVGTEDSGELRGVALGTNHTRLAVGFISATTSSAIVKGGWTADTTWGSLFPDTVPYVVPNGVAIAPGTQTAVIVGVNSGAQGEPLAFRNCLGT